MDPLQAPVLPDSEPTGLLRDDAPDGELTTEDLGISSARGGMVFRVRRPMIVRGVEEAARVIALAGATARVLRPSGHALAGGESVLEAKGSAAALHRGCKATPVSVEWSSGIATATVAGGVRADPATAYAEAGADLLVTSRPPGTHPPGMRP